MSKDEQIAFLKTEKEQLNSENVDLKFQLAQLKKLVYGTKSERQITTESSDQLNLFGEQVEDKEDELLSEPITYTRSKQKKNHPGRHRCCYLPTPGTQSGYWRRRRFRGRHSRKTRSSPRH